MPFFFDIIIVKQLYNFDVLKAWDYARTIFRSEKLRIAYIKAEKDTKKHICWYFEGQKVVPQGPFGQNIW